MSDSYQRSPAGAGEAGGPQQTGGAPSPDSRLPGEHAVIREIVAGLTKISGVLGAVLTAEDGMPIAAELSEGMDEGRVAAMAAEIGRTTGESLERVERGPMGFAMFDAERGKMFLGQAGKGFLVVLADHSVNLGLLRLEMTTAAERIRKL